jgi:hypothetical protein
MPAWWDSLSTVSGVAAWLRLVLFGLSVLTVAVTGLTLWVGARQSSLQATRDQQRDTLLSDAREKLASRVLTTDQIAALTNLLSDYPPSPVEIVAHVGDVERTRLAEQIKAAFVAAGFKPRGVLTGLAGLDATGVYLVCMERGSGPPFGRKLQEFFEGAKIGGDPRIDPKLPADGIRVVVAQKATPP